MEKNDTKFNGLKDILHGAGVSFVLGMVSYILMFFFKLAAARYFGPSDFGMYEMTVTILGIIFVFSSLGFPNGIKRFVPEYLKLKKLSLLRGYHNFINLFSLIISVVFGFCLFVMSGYITEFLGFPAAFSLFLKIVSISVPFKNMAKMMGNFLLAEKKVFKGILGSYVAESSILLISVLMILVFKLSLVWMIVFLTLSYFGNFLLCLYFYRRSGVPHVKSAYRIRSWLKFSLPLMFTGVLAYLLNWTDNLVIGTFLSEYELGIYGVAYSMANYVIFVPNIFMSLFLPVMTGLYLSSRKEFHDTFNHVLKLVFISTCFLGSIFIFFSGDILAVLFGNSYAGGASSFSILSLFFMLASLFSFSHVIIMIKKNTNFLFINTLIFALFNLFLSIILGKIYGIVGVAFASGLSLLLLRIVEFLKSRKDASLFDRSQVIIYFKIISSSLAGIVFLKLLLTLLSDMLIHNALLKIIIASVMCFCIFLFALMKLKVINHDDVEILSVLEDRYHLKMGLVKRIIRKLL